jgi:hypothetical protein
VPFRTTGLGPNEFEDNIEYSEHDLTNGKNAAAEKMGDNDGPMILCAGQQIER